MSQDKLILFADFFKFTQNYGFRFVGLNPYFERKKVLSDRRKLCNAVLFHFNFWIVTITVCLEFLFIFSIFGQMEQFMEFCKTLSAIAYDLMGAELLLLMWTSGGPFNELILELEDMYPIDMETQKHYKVPRQAEKTELTLKITLFSFMLCLSTWLIAPVYEIAFCYFTDTEYILELPFSIWMPSILNETVATITSLFLVVITMYASVMSILSVNMFYVSIVSQIELQFEILAQNIRNLPKNNTLALHQVIEQHNRLIETSKAFAKLISRSVFFNQLLSTLGICSGLFELAMSDEIFQYIVYLFAITTQTFTLSFVGDQLMRSSIKIADAAYESNWMSSSRPMRLSIVQIINRAQKPLTVNGLGFFHLTLDTFKKILTRSFSYYALLRSFID